MGDPIEIDGSYGEGGGQILRTALSLSTLTGRPSRISRVRAGRREPGLRPQHLAAVRALASICGAEVAGDSVGSDLVRFAPTHAPVAGDYAFDIAAVAGSGSAGAVTLLLQSLLLPLSLATGTSRVRLAGGTHVAWSPPYHYLAEVYLPLIERIGFRARLELGMWGWYPKGGGVVSAEIEGLGPTGADTLRPLDVRDRGKLASVWGVSAASNLPEHIIERQRSRAIQRLRARHIRADIERVAPPSPGPGTVVFLVAEYEQVNAGFTGYGRLRYPAEKVADDAVDAFEAHLRSKAALDPHLADQVLLPLALAPGASAYTTSAVTRHLLTVRWAIQRFIEREIVITGDEGQVGTVCIA